MDINLNILEARPTSQILGTTNTDSELNNMNITLFNNWLSALRSGKYKQGVLYLRNRDNYCCLGVLCDLVNDQAWELDSDGRYLYPDGSVVLPPTELLTTVGLDEIQTGALATMNDTFRWSFEMIANKLQSGLSTAEAHVFNIIGDNIRRGPVLENIPTLEIHLK